MTTLRNITPAWVERATSGDRAAVEFIVRTLQGPVFATARRMLFDRQDAEDATQEALVRVITHLGQFRQEAQFSTWAFSIAIRRILDFREQRAAATRGSLGAFALDLADGLEHGAPERTEDAYLHAELRQRCAHAMLHCLDGDHRLAYILGELLELPSQEAADILRLEPATFRKRLSRARADLEAFLKRHCGVVSAEAPCACHRRQTRALALGRLSREDAGPPEESVVQLRARIQALREAQRAAAFFKASRPDDGPDFAATIRDLLSQPLSRGQS